MIHSRGPRRDPAFLRIAALAGFGGTLAIVLSIAFPLWAMAHGRPVTPAFMLFAGWGVAALGGAYACVCVYRQTGPPGPPPRGGGVRLTAIHSSDAAAPREAAAEVEKRAA